jgi:hypothetical protein
MIFHSQFISISAEDILMDFQGSSKAQVDFCLFQNNSASVLIRLGPSTSLSFSNFSFNEVDTSLIMLDKNPMSENFARQQPILDGCTFYRNINRGFGGKILDLNAQLNYTGFGYFSGNPYDKVIIVNCTFQENKANC